MCDHLKTHGEDWPDGGGIEVCDICGMSRYVWEQGEGNWIMIDDIPVARKEEQEYMDSIMTKGE